MTILVAVAAEEQIAEMDEVDKGISLKWKALLNQAEPVDSAYSLV